MKKKNKAESGETGNAPIIINNPSIGWVPIPSLSTDDITVGFQMEVTSPEVLESSNSPLSDTSWTGVDMDVDIYGKVSSSCKNTRPTNQTMKYQVHVTGIAQHRPSEGLSKLMDIMASCIKPITTNPDDNKSNP